MTLNKTANVNVRIQENIKQQAEQILDTIGIPRATAIDIFYRQIILNNGIPFSLKIPKYLPVRETMDEKAFKALVETSKKGLTEKVVKTEVKVEKEVNKETKASSNDLESKTLKELKELAKEKNVEGYSTMKKAELLEALK